MFPSDAVVIASTRVSAYCGSSKAPIVRVTETRWVGGAGADDEQADTRANGIIADRKRLKAASQLSLESIHAHSFDSEVVIAHAHDESRVHMHRSKSGG